MTIKGKLVLESGEVFDGTLYGASDRPKSGEVVFSTAMTGYQEMLTDPSFCEQIVVSTTAHVGNVGINPWDMESHRVQVKGLIVNQLCLTPASWRSHGSLDQWLEDAGIPILANVLTRELVLRLRDQGVTRGWVGKSEIPTEIVLQQLKDTPGMLGRSLTKQVTCASPYVWSEGSSDIFNQPKAPGRAKKQLRVAVLDFGVKRSILRSLVDNKLSVTVFPAHTPAKELLKEKPNGIFLSNGPGDPAANTVEIETIKELLGQKPMFGICLGHQLLGVALGAKTFKLPFGHRGINHPVKNLRTGHVEITSQNHGFSIDGKSLPGDVECTHISLNDQTVEGLACLKKKAFSVQYHPESFPGPRDSEYLFSQFVELIHDGT